jgi:hypothetical protein
MAKLQEFFTLHAFAALQSKLSLTKPRVSLRSVTTAKRSTTYGKLQATSPLLVVWEQPPAQRLSREREPFFNTDMLQLPPSRRKDSTFFQLSGLHACKRRDAKKEVQKKTQDYD